MIENISAIVFGLGTLVAPIAGLVWIVQAIRKKDTDRAKRTFLISTIVAIVAFIVFGAAYELGKDTSEPEPSVTQGEPVASEPESGTSEPEAADKHSSETTGAAQGDGPDAPARNQADGDAADRGPTDPDDVEIWVMTDGFDRAASVESVLSSVGMGSAA